MHRFIIPCGYIFAVAFLCVWTWAAWQWRFIPASGVPALTLAHTPANLVRIASGAIEEKPGELTLKAADVPPQIEYEWLAEPENRYAHVTFKVSCRGVKSGKMPWDDARVALVWVDDRGKILPEHFVLWWGKYDQPPRRVDMIVPLERKGALPRLIINNRGSAGTFAFGSFHLQALQQRSGFGWHLVLLIGGWSGLVLAGLRRWVAKAEISSFRLIAATILWTGFAWVSSLPGPWIPLQPILRPFPVAAVAPPVITATPFSAPAKPRAETGVDILRSSGPPEKVPVPAPPPEETGKIIQAADKTPASLDGGMIRWYFNKLRHLKRILHFCVFSVLALSFALLLGTPRSAAPALALSFLSELCQWLFGFGFDSGDLLDLLLDASAVFAGVGLWWWVATKRSWRQLFPSADRVPADSRQAICQRESE